MGVVDFDIDAIELNNGRFGDLVGIVKNSHRITSHILGDKIARLPFVFVAQIVFIQMVPKIFAIRPIGAIILLRQRFNQAAPFVFGATVPNHISDDKRPPNDE